MMRRNFLKGLAGAIASAPSAAKKVTDLSLHDKGINIAPTGYPTLNFSSSVSDYPSNDDGGMLEAMKKNLYSHLHEKTWRDFLPQVHVMAIDPDLDSMRSVSLSAKINIQRKRLAKREYELEKNLLERRIRDILMCSGPARVIR